MKNNKKETLLKVKVQLMVAGKLFNEIFNAANYHEAQQVALARNPNARVVSVNAIMESFNDN